MRGCAADGVFRQLASCIAVAAIALLPLAARAQFDHGHRGWTLLLQKHVTLVDGGRASRADYRGFARDRAALKVYLGESSRAGESEFRGWSRLQQMAYWYGADWSSGYRGIGAGEPILSLSQYFARYAALLSDDPAQQRRIASQQAGIRFLEYDWRLNGVKVSDTLAGDAKAR